MFSMWVWLLAMVLQIALLGRQLHCVVLLADLETDIQNPHDWAREMNRFRVREGGGGGGAASLARERGGAARSGKTKGCSERRAHATQIPPPTTANNPPKKTAEYLGQPLLAVLLLSQGWWLSGAANALLSLFVLYRLLHLAEDRAVPADAFRDAASHRRNRFALLTAHAALFALVMFRLVERAIGEMLEHHHQLHGGGEAGAEAARRLTRELLREAAASVHGY
jgi:hypothetical protein